MRLSFPASLSRIGVSLKGVPSGEVARLEGEFCGRSPGFLGVDGGLEAGGIDGAALGIGEAFSKRLSFPFPLSGVSAGLVDVTGAVVAAAAGAGVVPGAGAAGEALAGLCAVSAFSRGLMVGGGTFLGSSLFIFCFSSA